VEEMGGREKCRKACSPAAQPQCIDHEQVSAQRSALSSTSRGRRSFACTMDNTTAYAMHAVHNLSPNIVSADYNHLLDIICLGFIVTAAP
jgi:hypothetical protein